MSILTLAPDGQGTKFMATAASLGMSEAEGTFYVTARMLTPNEVVRLRELLQHKMYDLVHAEVRGQA